MDSKIKKLAVTGLIWTSMETIFIQFFMLLTQVVLARLLSPKDFGTIAMITIFIAIAQMFLDGGFQNALIREKNVSDRDYSTVFFFNFFMSIFLYVLLFNTSSVIATFYETPQLEIILKVLGINLIINSLTLVQRTMAIHSMDFKKQSKIAMVSSVTSGVIGILFATLDFGVWSLVAQQVTLSITQFILYTYSNRWIPILSFDVGTFKHLFQFGWKLTVANLIITLYENSYYTIIGKTYSITYVGYYTNAKKFNDVPINAAVKPLRTVSYPLLSKFKDNEEELKNSYKRIIRYSTIISFPLMLGLCAIAQNLIPFVFGIKWSGSIEYFQLFCIAGMFYPLTYLNLNILQVKGKASTYLFLEISKLVIGIFFIIIVLFFKLDLIYLVLSNIFTLIINTFCCMYITSRVINYPLNEQVKDFLYSLINSIIMAVMVFYLGNSIKSNILFMLIIQIIIGVVIYLFFSIFIFKINELVELKKYVIKKIVRYFD